MNLLKTLPIYILANKNLILRKTWKQMYSFNLYDWSANCRDFSKAWQMKLKLWQLILQENVKISSGRKNQTFGQIYVLKFFLSLPITFPILVNVNPYQICIQNTQITVFNFFPTKLGVLPILQECPSCCCSCTTSNSVAPAHSTNLPWSALMIYSNKLERRLHCQTTACVEHLCRV